MTQSVSPSLRSQFSDSLLNLFHQGYYTIANLVCLFISNSERWQQPDDIVYGNVNQESPILSLLYQFGAG